ncbi:hypothetical protein C8R47DRAFT_1211857 [Mycena vitilis]|nr:hypothetical protein C8R47DRAFT_1211857 [Mycena vitilis]
MAMQVQHSPEDLVRRWEDIHFLTVFDSVYEDLGRKPDGEIPEAQISPQLIRIIHAYQHLRLPDYHFPLFDIRLVLDCSWDDLRAAICPLRDMFQEDETALHTFCGAMLHRTRMRELHPEPNLEKIAKGCMRVVNSDFHQLFDNLGPLGCWSFILRSCPPSSDLLNGLRQISRSKILSRWGRHQDYIKTELYNITQWLENIIPRGLW